MNKLTTKARAQILGMMVEGMSIRGISRMTGASKNTIVKLLADAGPAFMAYMDDTLRNLPCKRVQCDEIWSFVGAKQKNVPDERQSEFGVGDVWTWTAIDADTKLVPCFAVGSRDAVTAYDFMQDLASRLSNRIQLTTDGNKAYLHAVERAMGHDVDYAMLIKLYGEPKGTGPDRRYSSGAVTGTIKGAISGQPDIEHVSTSYVERQNLSMRMGMRRFTRLTNAFSKKFENHVYAIAVYFMHYNFARVHQTLRVSPAMEAGVTNTLMSLEDMVAIVDAYRAANPR